MTDPDTISADYTLRPSELAATLALLVEARQPTLVWGPPGGAKSAIAQQVAADAGRRYVDVRALLLDPVDLRGIPWRDSADRTRWAPPAFLPPTDDPGRWLINLEELPSAVPMVQAALYQLVLDRKVGEYELPEGASLIACGNRESDRGVVHRMPTPLASRFVHLEIRVDAQDWLAWAAAHGIAPEVLFYIQMRPDMLHRFDPQSREKAFCCPRTWEMVSNIVNRRNGLDPSVERALFRTVARPADLDIEALLRGEVRVPRLHGGDDVVDGAALEGVHGRGPGMVEMAQLRVALAQFQLLAVLKLECDAAVCYRDHLCRAAVHQPQAGVVAGPADAVAGAQLDVLGPVDLAAVSFGFPPTSSFATETEMPAIPPRSRRSRAVGRNRARRIVGLKASTSRSVTSGIEISGSLCRSGNRMGLRQDANPRVSLAAADLSTRT